MVKNIPAKRTRKSVTADEYWDYRESFKTRVEAPPPLPVAEDPYRTNRFRSQHEFGKRFDPVAALLKAEEVQECESYLIERMSQFRPSRQYNALFSLAVSLSSLLFNKDRIYEVLISNIADYESWPLLNCLLRDCRQIAFDIYSSALLSMAASFGQHFDQTRFRSFFDFLCLGFNSVAHTSLSPQTLPKLWPSFKALFGHCNKFIRKFSAQALAFLLKGRHPATVSSLLQCIVNEAVSNVQPKLVTSIAQFYVEYSRGLGKHLSQQGLNTLKSLWLVLKEDSVVNLQFYNVLTTAILASITSQQKQDSLVQHQTFSAGYYARTVLQAFSALPHKSPQVHGLLGSQLELLYGIPSAQSELNAALKSYTQVKPQTMQDRLQCLRLTILYKTVAHTDYSALNRLEPGEFKQSIEILLGQGFASETELPRIEPNALVFQLYRLLISQLDQAAEEDLLIALKVNYLSRGEACASSKVRLIQCSPEDVLNCRVVPYLKHLLTCRTYSQINSLKVMTDKTLFSLFQGQVNKLTLARDYGEIARLPLNAVNMPLPATVKFLEVCCVMQEMHRFMVAAGTPSPGLEGLYYFSRSTQHCYQSLSSQPLLCRLKELSQKPIAGALEEGLQHERQMKMLMGKVKLLVESKGFRKEVMSDLGALFIMMLKHGYTPFAEAAIDGITFALQQRNSQELAKLVERNVWLYNYYSSIKQDSSPRVVVLTDMEEMHHQFANRIFSRLCKILSAGVPILRTCAEQMRTMNYEAYCANRKRLDTSLKLHFAKQKLISLIEVDKGFRLKPWPELLFNQTLHQAVIRAAEAAKVKKLDWGIRADGDENRKHKKAQREVQMMVEMELDQQQLFLAYQLSFLANPVPKARRRALTAIVNQEIAPSLYPSCFYAFFGFGRTPQQQSLQNIQLKTLSVYLSAIQTIFEVMSTTIEESQVLVPLQWIVLKGLSPLEQAQNRPARNLKKAALSALQKFYRYFDPKKHQQFDRAVTSKITEELTAILNSTFSEVPFVLKIVAKWAEYGYTQVFESGLVNILARLIAHQNCSTSLIVQVVAIVRLLVEAAVPLGPLLQSLMARLSNCDPAAAKSVIGLFQVVDPESVATMPQPIIQTVVNKSCERLFQSLSTKKSKTINTQSAFLKNVLTRCSTLINADSFVDRFGDILETTASLQLRTAIVNALQSAASLSQTTKDCVAAMNRVVKIGLQEGFDEAGFGPALQKIAVQSETERLLIANNLLFFCCQTSYAMRHASIFVLSNLIRDSGSSSLVNVIEAKVTRRLTRSLNVEHEFKAMAELFIAVQLYYKRSSQWPTEEHRSLAAIVEQSNSPLHLVISLSQVKRVQGLSQLQGRTESLLIPFVQVFIRGFLNQSLKERKGLKSQWMTVGRSAIQLYGRILASQPATQLKRVLRKLIFKGANQMTYRVLDSIIMKLELSSDSMEAFIRDKGSKQAQALLGYRTAGQYEFGSQLQKFVYKKVMTYLKGLLYKEKDSKKERLIKLEASVNVLMLKVLFKLNRHIFAGEAPGLIRRVILLLKKRDFDAREGARHTLVDLVKVSGPCLLPSLIASLKELLKDGHQPHIRNFTINKLLTGLGRLAQSCHELIPQILPCLFDEIFGRLASQKENKETEFTLPQLTKRTALDSINCLGTTCSLSEAFPLFLQAVQSEIRSKPASETEFNRAQQIFGAWLSGMQNNPTFEPSLSTHILAYLKKKQEAGNRHVQEAPRCEKERQEFEQTRTRANFEKTFSIQTGAASKKSVFQGREVKKASGYQTLNQLVVLCLSTFKLLLEKFKDQVPAVEQQLQVICLGFLDSESNRVVEEGLKVIVLLGKHHRLSHSRNLLEKTLELLGRVTDRSIARELFRIVRSALYAKTVFGKSQVDALIRAARVQDDREFEMVQLIECAVSLVARGVRSAELQHWLLQLREGMLLSSRPAVRTLIRDTLLQYFAGYELHQEVRQNYIHFFIKNLESPQIEGRKTLLTLLVELPALLQPQELNHNGLLLLIALVFLYSKDHRGDERPLISQVFKAVFSRIDKAKVRQLQVQAINWLQNETPSIQNCGGLVFVICKQEGVDVPKDLAQLLQVKALEKLAGAEADLQEQKQKFLSQRNLKGLELDQNWQSTIELLNSKQAVDPAVLQLQANCIDLLQLDEGTLQLVTKLANSSNTVLERRAIASLLSHPQLLQSNLQRLQPQVLLTFRLNMLYKGAGQFHSQFVKFLLELVLRIRPSFSQRLFNSIQRNFANQLKFKSRTVHAILELVLILADSVALHRDQAWSKCLLFVNFRLQTNLAALVEFLPALGEAADGLQDRLKENLGADHVHRAMMALRQDYDSRRKELRRTHLEQGVTDPTEFYRRKIRKQFRE